ncbi:MAG: hypothetical protein K8Q99_05945 [Acholeplasmataceae bacterium]|nr:hypothetical protein [Acholeplasmataceae bacterium]
MKKLSVIFIFTALIFSLAACKDSIEVQDIQITYSEGESTSNSLVYQVNISITLKNIEELEEIAYNVASQLYEQNFEMIGSDVYLLTLNISNSQTEGLYGSISFDINKSMQTPGLTLNSNDLSL